MKGLVLLRLGFHWSTFYIQCDYVRPWPLYSREFHMIIKASNKGVLLIANWRKKIKLKLVYGLYCIFWFYVICMFKNIKLLILLPKEITPYQVIYLFRIGWGDDLSCATCSLMSKVPCGAPWRMAGSLILNSVKDIVGHYLEVSNLFVPISLFCSRWLWSVSNWNSTLQMFCFFPHLSYGLCLDCFPV